MLKEHERRRYLDSLGKEQRLAEERRLEEQKQRHRQHPRLNVPVRPRPQGSARWAGPVGRACCSPPPTHITGRAFESLALTLSLPHRAVRPS